MCIYEVHFPYPSPVPGVIRLLAGCPRKRAFPSSAPMPLAISWEACQSSFSIHDLLTELDICLTSSFPTQKICQDSYLASKGSPALPWPSATTNVYVYANSNSLPPPFLVCRSFSFVLINKFFFIISAPVCLKGFCDLLSRIKFFWMELESHSFFHEKLFTVSQALW